MAITLRFDSPENSRRSTVYRSWGYSDRKTQAGVKISQQDIDKAKAEFLPKVKIFTIEDVIKRGVLSGKRKRGGWHGASPSEKASGIKGVVEDEIN